MKTWTVALAFLGFSFLLCGETSWATTIAGPVTVKCRLKMRYRVHTGSTAIDAVRKYTCDGTVIATSDVDALDVATRQVVFRLDACPRLPATVVFGSQGVTEVREYRGNRVRAHVLSGECKGCVIAANTDLAVPQLDSGHFDAVFTVRPLDTLPNPSIDLPAGKGLLSLRSERTDDEIVRGAWAARKCVVTPRPPIFCGGFAGVLCPDGLKCVDWPADDCDPANGGADCIGICVLP